MRRRWGDPFWSATPAEHIAVDRTSSPWNQASSTSHSLATQVLTVHDMVLQDMPHDFGLAKRLLLRAPYAGSIRDADVLVCVSEATRARLVVRAPSVDTRISVVPLAVSGDLLQAAPRPVRTLVDKAFALVVGDSSPRKNLAMLVGIWDQVCARVPGAVLAIAGPPSWAGSSHGESFERLVQTGDVVPLGHVPDNELRWCYENAVIALCPSLLEGFGLPADRSAGVRCPINYVD